MLVKIDKLIFVVNFVVLDMGEDTKAPLIFLTTTQVLIDVKNGELKIRVGDEHVKFNLYQSMQLPNEDFHHTDSNSTNHSKGSDNLH